jgi:hypothetical protein
MAESHIDNCSINNIRIGKFTGDLFYKYSVIMNSIIQSVVFDETVSGYQYNGLGTRIIGCTITNKPICKDGSETNYIDIGNIITKNQEES